MPDLDNYPSIEIPTGDVYIITRPTGAEIYMDNKLVIDLDTFLPIKTPTILAVTQGYHNLKFKLKNISIYDAIYVFPEHIIYIYKNFNIYQ